MIVLELDLPRDGPSVAMVEEAVRRVEERGVRFSTLADEGDWDAVQRLYDLVREGVVDDPSGDGTFVPFAVFDNELYGPYYERWAEAQFLAVHEGRWVGLANPQFPSPEVMQLGITVVRRAYRRRGIALALKLLALQHAWKTGVTQVRTQNHKANVAILELNRSLGFAEVAS